VKLRDRLAHLNEEPDLARADGPERMTARTPEEDAGEERFGRSGLLVAGAVALVVAFIQAPGNIVDDTKLPVDISPLSFMANSLHLWNPVLSSGGVQTQTFGYLFPMGPFFAVGHVLHVPVWITERIWLALLLTVAFWGVVRLAEELCIGNRKARAVGAVAYTIAPIVVTWAAQSADLLAVVMLPWILVPLVRGAAGGSPRRAAAASGVAIALVGGVNATVVLATLPMAVIWLLTRQRGSRRRALMGWWVVAVVLACFWWAAALLLQSHYAYNYLPYTETSTVTTATTSLFEAVRGASFWTNYLTVGGPLIPATWTLISMVPLILGTSAVAALGLIGLARRGLPERLFLVASLSFGVLAIAVAYSGPLGGPAASGVRGLLQSPFALLRNVSKFSPDVALPLALGLVWFLSTIPSRQTVDRAPRPRWLPKSLVRWGFPLVTAAALLGASAPFWQAKLYPPGGFSAIPSYWNAAARWLDGHQDHGTALLVPGAAFAKYTWGNPLDEPFYVDMSTNWSVRSIVPLGSNGNDLVLDTVEASLDQGVVVPGMAAYLARNGFDYVVERNDLNLAATKAPDPAQVHQVLSETPGLQEVATFGPVIPIKQATTSRLSIYDTATATRHLHSIIIYKVVPTTTIVRTYPASDPVVVSGSPSSLLPLLASGILKNRAAVVAGDPHGGDPAKASSATWADTDGNQRRDVSFGLIRNNASYVLGPHQRTSAAIANVPENLAVATGVQHQTVANPLGVASTSASSFGSTTLTDDPAEGPAAVFGTNEFDAWVASNVHNSAGQWVQVNFTHSIKLDRFFLTPLNDTPRRPRVTEITISTARGSVRRKLKTGVNVVRAKPGSTSWLRITLTGVRPPKQRPRHTIPLGAGLTGLAIPGISFQQAFRLPSDEASAFASGRSKNLVYSFNAPLVNANLDLDAPVDDDPQMVRRFTVPKATSVKIAGTATPLPGPALNALIQAPESYVLVSATSTLGGLPRFSAENLISNSDRPWIASIGTKHPAFTISWLGKRPVGSLTLEPASEASVPRRVIVSSPSGRALVNVPPGGGTITFPTMVTDSLTVTVVKATRKTDKLPFFGTKFTVPVGLKHVSVPVLGTVNVTAPSKVPFSLPCGKGPDLQLDGQVIHTAVSGSIADLEDLRPLKLSVCQASVTLSPGDHIFAAQSVFSAFKVTTVLARPTASQPSVPQRSTRIVGQWTAEHRTVDVSAGAASYLAVTQNYNSGWRATLDGKQLDAVRVDGWQQAWIVPAGSGGTVTMVYAPGTRYELALILGGVLLCVLGLLVVVKGRRRDEPLVGPRRVSPVIVGAAGLVVLALVAGPLALAFLPLLLVTARWGRNATAYIAGGAFMAAGLVAALSPGAQPHTRLGAFAPAAQALTAMALAAVLASLVAHQSSRFRILDDPADVGPLVVPSEGESFDAESSLHSSSEDGSPEDGSPEDGSPEDDSSENDSPEDDSPEDGSPEDGSPEDGSPEDGSPEDGSPEDGSPEDGSPEDGSPEDGSPEDGSPEDGSAKKGSSKKGSSKKSSSKKGSPRKDKEGKKGPGAPVP
jgi:arabinofuranan 3-O-arabinosyltransferase